MKDIHAATAEGIAPLRRLRVFKISTWTQVPGIGPTDGDHDIAHRARFPKDRLTAALLPMLAFCKVDNLTRSKITFPQVKTSRQ